MPRHNQPNRGAGPGQIRPVVSVGIAIGCFVLTHAGAGYTARVVTPPIAFRTNSPFHSLQTTFSEGLMEHSLPDAPQRFVISHHAETDFKTGGLRAYSAYRDLGVATATNGLVKAHVVRMIAPFHPESSVRHHHNVQFQLVYCLKGWFETDFEGIGPQRLVAGSCWIQPPGIRHTVVGWSDDCELLEILIPAEHETINDP